MKLQRQQVVLQGHDGAAQSALQTPDLDRPLFDALSQSLKLRRQDRARMSTAHRERGGICLSCGDVLTRHFDHTNKFVPCQQGANRHG